LPQRGDVLGEVVLLDHEIRPDRLQQLILAQRFTWTFHQVQQGVEHLARQRHRLARAAP
jgi:hypothetical protein